MILLISLAFGLVALAGSFGSGGSSPGKLIVHGFSCSSALLGTPPIGLTFLLLNVPSWSVGDRPRSESYAASRSSELRRPSLGDRDLAWSAATRGVIRLASAGDWPNRCAGTGELIVRGGKKSDPYEMSLFALVDGGR